MSVVLFAPQLAWTLARTGSRSCSRQRRSEPKPPGSDRLESDATPGFPTTRTRIAQRADTGPRLFATSPRRSGSARRDAPYRRPLGDARQRRWIRRTWRSRRARARRTRSCSSCSADPGDAVLVPAAELPTVRTSRSVRRGRGRPVPARLRRRLAPRREREFERAVTARTRAIVVVSPNNPTGSYLKRDELAALSRARVADRLRRGVRRLFARRRSEARRLGARSVRDALVFALDGLSKFAALPQMKLAWITLGGPAALVDEALAAASSTCATRFSSPASPVQHALAALIELHRADARRHPASRRRRTTRRSARHLRRERVTPLSRRRRLVRRAAPTGREVRRSVGSRAARVNATSWCNPGGSTISSTEPFVVTEPPDGTAPTSGRRARIVDYVAEDGADAIGGPARVRSERARTATARQRPRARRPEPRGDRRPKSVPLRRRGSRSRASVRPSSLFVVRVGWAALPVRRDRPGSSCFFSGASLRLVASSLSFFFFSPENTTARRSMTSFSPSKMTCIDLTERSRPSDRP